MSEVGKPQLVDVRAVRLRRKSSWERWIIPYMLTGLSPVHRSYSGVNITLPGLLLQLYGLISPSLYTSSVKQPNQPGCRG